MKLEDQLEFGGIELSNGNRTRAYLSAGLFSLPITRLDCGCSTIGDMNTYVSPLADPAPWYATDRAESAEFLGFMAHDIRLDSVAVRSVTPKLSGGATIGRRYLRHRILAIRGVLFAQTAQGQAYGESWLRDVLGGVSQGCSPDTIRILLSCPPVSTAADVQWRSLRKVGIVDGPSFGPVNELAECFIQEVSFQVAAGVPWLMSDKMVCLAETVLVGGS